MDSELIDWLREDLDGPAPDVPSGMVERAVATGRRRRHRRRVAVGALGGTLAVAALVGAVAFGGSLGRQATPAPAASPSPVVTSSPTSSPTPAAFRATPAEVEQTLRDLVPSSYTITRSVGKRDASVGEVSGYLYLRDARGAATVFGGVGEDRSGLTDLCRTNANCTETPLDGGHYWSMRSPAGEKAGDDLTVYFGRPDGTYVWLTQANTEDGNGPVTRPELALTDVQARELVTDPAWDDVIH